MYTAKISIYSACLWSLVGLITQYVILSLEKKRNAGYYLLKTVLTSGDGRRSSKGNVLVDLVEGAGKKTDVDTKTGQTEHLFA